MRLGLIYHQFVDSGGLEKYLLGLSRTLVDSGHQLDVVTAKTDAITRAESGIRLHMLKRPPLSSMLRLWDFAWRSESFCRNDERFRSSVDLTVGFGRTISQDMHRAGGGCHAIYSRLLPASKRLGLKNRLELSLEWQLYNSGKTRHFVVNASKVRDELQQTYGIDPAKCSVIHTAVNTTQFFPAESESQRQILRHELGMPTDRKIALFVSSSHRRKGLGTILNALSSSASLADLDVWIAGKALDARHRQMAQAIPGLLPRLKFLGERSDLPALYRACDVFVHPTLYDACANTVLQAMSSGTPSIVSAADGAAEFIDHGRNGFLLKAPTASDELRHHLEVASSLAPITRAQIAEAARNRMLPLTWHAHVTKWEVLFEELKRPTPA
ncbi:MAG: glycosyltransferase family 4 protein [Verrucomicrobia bacterium]|nr:glycosyltransferase family 4 protein [Verrucomicrobiota bacterium]